MDEQKADQATSPNQAGSGAPASGTADEAPASPWQFKSEKDLAADNAPVNNLTSDVPADAPAEREKPAEIQPITWSASEFVAHKKSVGWYAALALVAIVLAAASYFLTHSIASTVVVPLVALAFGYYAARQPRVLNYQLDARGLTVAEKLYAFGDFKSFALVNEGAFSSILLLPLKRFVPPLSIYFAPDDQPKIMNVLQACLPIENYQPDYIDRLMRRVRF
ncbi:MAG: hypothetical protein ACREGA_04040 [Candidatus Saccharimonadales bacterium]